MLWFHECIDRYIGSGNGNRTDLNACKSCPDGDDFRKSDHYHSGSVRKDHLVIHERYGVHRSASGGMEWGSYIAKR